MKFPLWFIFVLMFALAAVVFGQVKEDLEITEEEPEKKLEWNGNLDVKYSLFNMDQNSALYKLQFFKNPPSSSLFSQYRLEPYLNAEYRTSDLGFVLKTHASYYSDTNSRFDLFEAYASFSPSFNTNLQAGKRVYSWGKGYAFNPVGFVNPVKDPENPELAQAGLLSANIEYVKSFSSDALQSFSFLAVLIPTSDIAGTSFGEFNNIEIHGELSYNQNADRFTIVNGSLSSARVDEYSFLLGLRYLDASNTTIIAEYYHSGAGLSKDEYYQYSQFLNNGAENINPIVTQQTLGVSQTYFRGTTLMQDYLYLKISQPEPFDWLYFTPSLYTIYNLTDNSFLLSFYMSYKPITNTEFIFWTTMFAGDNTTEYGAKQVQQRTELWMRVFF